MTWFKDRIHHYASILGIQKVRKYYSDGRPLHLITLMALREAGERHHDNAGSRKLSAVAAGHTMQVRKGTMKKSEMILSRYMRVTEIITLHSQRDGNTDYFSISIAVFL